jgi:hypothetical protein
LVPVPKFCPQTTFIATIFTATTSADTSQGTRVDTMGSGSNMTVESPQPEFETLYHRAFADYKLRALWNVRELEHPSPEQALTMARNLRVKGDLSARLLAEQLERACRATL